MKVPVEGKAVVKSGSRKCARKNRLPARSKAQRAAKRALYVK